MRILAITPRTDDARRLDSLCRQVLAGLLEHFDAAPSVGAAAVSLRHGAFELVLLDPQLPDGDGLGLIASGALRAAQTIIVSADPATAVRAFDCGALDFVPRPVTRERLAKALLRVVPPRPAADTSPRFLAVRRFGRIEFIDVEQLVYIEASDKYCELVLANGQRSFYDQSLGRLETTLPPSFLRIHKSYLVRFPLISRLLVKKGSRYFAELKDGRRLPVGRSRYGQIKSRLL